MSAREALLAWAESPGFAAIHKGQATNEQIVDNLLEWLATAGFVIIPSEEFEDLKLIRHVHEDE